MPTGSLTFTNPARWLLGLACWVLTTALGWAQAPAITLTLDSEAGLVEVRIGGSVQRDPADGRVYLSGGVEIHQPSGDLISADQVIFIPLEDHASGTDTPLRDMRRVASIQAQGQIYVRQGQVDLHAQSLQLSQDFQRFSLLGQPVSMQDGTYALQADQGMVGDLEQGLFYGFGGAEFASETGLVRGDQIQIILPERAGGYPRILARGTLRLESDGVVLQADQLATDETGTLIQLSGQVRLQGPNGQIEAGSVLYNRDSQEFSLESGAADTITSQEFFRYE